MTALDITLPFGLGVISSLHCAQMCGPVVVAYSMGGRGASTGHLCYNGGRITTYAVLGALAGALGDTLTRIAGIQQTAAIVSGVLMVIAGVLMSGVVPARKLVQIAAPSRLSRVAGRLMMNPRATHRLALGLVMGLLPCGLLYAALLKAASTGSALTGAVSMAAFGAGTAGTLLAIGLFSSAAGARLGRWSSPLASASVVAMGVVLVWRGVIAEVSCHAGV